MKNIFPFDCVNMSLDQRLVACALLLLCALKAVHTRSSQISDLKSKISGVEELLEEFRKQLQQDQEYQRGGDVMDDCLGDFNAVEEERIIRAMASIEQGATFLSAPGRVSSWEDCVHACCSEPHCTVAVVQKDLRQSDDGLGCYLFNCTYRNKNVCSFAPQQGFSTYNRYPNTTGHLPISSGHGDRNKMTNPARTPEESITDDDTQELDEPPRSDAGQDVVIQLPTDWAVLDGRDSVDDHAISRYEWTLIKGDSAINMKVTHPGQLKVSGLQQGVYTFLMTVTDSVGQKSSDNVSVTVLAPEHQVEVCTGHCSRYQFMCDDGCCVDITFACDGKQQCPDRSDEAFCQKFDNNRKSVTHSAGIPSLQRPVAQTEEAEDLSMLQTGPRKTMENIAPPYASSEPLDRTKVAPRPPVHPQGPSQQEATVSQDPCAVAPVVGPCKSTFPRWYYDREAGDCKHFLYGGCQGNHNNFLQEADCVNECVQKSPAFKPATVAPPTTRQTDTAVVPKASISQGQPETDIPISYPAMEGHPVPEAGVMEGHPVPESGAILPLALGLIITALLLLMISCRLRLVHHKLKKARPLTTEESDYLINGMYL